MAGSSSAKATSLRVGVLIIPPVQLLDAAPIDLFGMCSPEYLQATSLPKPLLQLAIPVSIHYISASGPDTSAELTANAFLRVTASLSSPEVQPGNLDTLLIPGPDPNLVPDDQYLDFIRAHDKAGQTDILVICTGSYAAGYAGILDGKRVSGPRGLLPELKKKFPKVNYVERRYETDGRLWSAGMIILYFLVQIDFPTTFHITCLTSSYNDSPDTDLSLFHFWQVASQMALTSPQHTYAPRSKQN